MPLNQNFSIHDSTQKKYYCKENFSLRIAYYYFHKHYNFCYFSRKNICQMYMFYFLKPCCIYVSQVSLLSILNKYKMNRTLYKFTLRFLLGKVLKIFKFATREFIFGYFNHILKFEFAKTTVIFQITTLKYKKKIRIKNALSECIAVCYLKEILSYFKSTASNL